MTDTNHPDTLRPKRTSMEGMIWNADHILSQALQPGIQGIPKGYFDQCSGVIIMSVVDVGAIFSGSVGSGILMQHNNDDSWSHPVACGLHGVGFGILVGTQAKELIIFLPDKSSIHTFFTKGIQLGVKNNVTPGLGREYDGNVGWSKSGSSQTVAFAFTKGAFINFSLEGAMVAPRQKVNDHFYDTTGAKPLDIVEGRVTFPYHKVTLYPDLVKKLKYLAKNLKLGDEGVAVEKNQEKMNEARVVADEAASDLHKNEDVVEVDAEAEAAKEAEAKKEAATQDFGASAAELGAETAAETTPQAAETTTEQTQAETAKES